MTSAFSYPFLPFINYPPFLPFSIPILFIMFAEPFCYLFSQPSSLCISFPLFLSLSLTIIFFPKSAQLPLPSRSLNATSAPTPVSPPSHSPTTVIAGVYFGSIMQPIGVPVGYISMLSRTNSKHSKLHDLSRSPSNPSL